MKTALFVLLLALLGTDRPAHAGVWDTLVTTKVSEIDLPSAILGEGWEVSPGLQVDDLSDTRGMAQGKREMVEMLAKQLTPVGIYGAADYSLITAGGGNVVTVRLYVFKDAEQCRAWWTKKYQYDGWEEHYVSVKMPETMCVDSLQMNKRAIAFGNVWLTAHQLRDGKEHLAALEYVATQLVSDDETTEEEKPVE